MERQKQQPQQQSTAGGGGPTPGHELSSTREELAAMHSQADAILNGFTPVNAENYLQQSRQRGAQ